MDKRFFKKLDHPKRDDFSDTRQQGETGEAILLLCLLVIVALVTGGCGRSDIRKGKASLELGDYAMAQQFFSAALKKNPENFNARIGMGKAYIQQAAERDDDTLLWRKALTHLEAARTINPDQNILPLLCEAWFVHSKNLLNRGDTLGALNSLSRAIEYQPEYAEPLSLAGIVYFNLGDPDKAELLFQQACTVDTANSSAPFNLGMLYWQQGNIAEAHRLWKSALTKAPDDDDILYWFARAEKRILEGK